MLHPSGCPPSRPPLRQQGHPVDQPARLAGPQPGGEPGKAAPAPAPDGTPRAVAAGALRLRLLATTDLHGQILSYDYFANRPQYGMGLAQTAALIAAARAEVPGAILLDNGDFLQGSALTELAARLSARPGRRRPHPAIAAFNALGYDAAALGNHEFNYGLALLQEAVAAAHFPVLSANVALELGARPTQDRLLCPPYALIRRELADASGHRHPLTVGVLGLTPPQIVDWDRHHLAGRIVVRGMVEAARAWLPEMQRAGADLVVCLAHTGVAPAAAAGSAGSAGYSGARGSEACAADLAALPGVAAVIAGHSHLVWPPQPLPGQPSPPAPEARIAGKPVVQPGHSGTHLGVIDLWLQPGPQGWRVADSRAGAISASEIVAGLPQEVIRAAAAPLRRELAADHRATLGWMRRGLGETPVALHSYFAAVAPSAAMQLLADAKVDHVRRALRGSPEGALPILASVTPFRMGGRGGALNFTEIAPGPLTLRNVLDLYPFPNTLIAEEVTGAQLARRLEAAVRLYRSLRPGVADQPLIDPGRPGTLFEVIPGLGYRIDLSRADGRISALTLNGRPLAPEARVVVVTNSFRAAAFPVPGARLVLDDRVPSSEVLADWLRRGGRPRAAQPPGWGFAPMPGTSIVFDSGARALRHLDEVAHLAPQFLGVTPQGFHRFRLHL